MDQSEEEEGDTTGTETSSMEHVADIPTERNPYFNPLNSPHSPKPEPEAEVATKENNTSIQILKRLFPYEKEEYLTRVLLEKREMTPTIEHILYRNGDRNRYPPIPSSPDVIPTCNPFISTSSVPTLHSTFSNFPHSTSTFPFNLSYPHVLPRTTFPYPQQSPGSFLPSFYPFTSQPTALDFSQGSRNMTERSIKDTDDTDTSNHE